MIKNYIKYIKESGKPKFFNVGDIIADNDNDDKVIQKKLEELAFGEVCIWYTRGNTTLKKQLVKDINLMVPSFGVSRGPINVYFNGVSVDLNYNVEIESYGKWVGVGKEIVGLPSGEVLYVTDDQMQKIVDLGFIRYNSGKKIYLFWDKNYHIIKKILDPTYKKPIKKNTEVKLEYDTGDIVICKGKSGDLDVTDRIGKITAKRLSQQPGSKSTHWNYSVSFIFKFSPYLQNGNKWWLRKENIKGIYKGDLEMQKTLSDLTKDRDLEEHEIDDEYHIKQLFKKPEIKIGDDVVLSNANGAIWSEKEQKFGNVWWKIGHVLGKVMEIKNIENEPCVKIDQLSAWYKMSCVEK